MTKCGLLVGGLALGLAEVASVRQKVLDTGNPVEAIGALLQERNMGSEDLMHQLSEYAAATPGAHGSFVKSLKALSQDIETKVVKKIRDGQTATQGKLDSLWDGLDTANTATDTAKKTAVESDESWFKCVGEEQEKRQDAEAKEESLADSRSNENEACQLQQDNKDFKFDATGKYNLDFECDHGVSGNCQAALRTWQESVLQKMFGDAEAAVAKDEKRYNTLKASCDAKKTARVQAQSTLNSAESAWSTKSAQCNKLESQRRASMCAFGTKAQAKCSAEADYVALVAATKKAQGDTDSEVDRENEWVASGTTKCMIEKSVLKGLKSNVDEADLNGCAGQLDFAQEVGKLNLRQTELDSMSKNNACAEGPITFSNGLTWNIPTGTKPSSKDYTRTEFTPQLDPSSGNFEFCSAVAPPVEAPPVAAPVPDECEAAVAKADMSGAQGDFKITAKIQTEQKAGTIFAKAFDKGLWKNGGQAGQGKMLFLRNGKVCFDIGWVGVVTGQTSVNDGSVHEVGVEFASGKYWVLVDGKREASGLRSVADHPDLKFSVGKAIGHKINGDVANGDMAPAFQGSITALSNGHC